MSVSSNDLATRSPQRVSLASHRGFLSNLIQQLWFIREETYDVLRPLRRHHLCVGSQTVDDRLDDAKPIPWWKAADFIEKVASSFGGHLNKA